MSHATAIPQTATSEDEREHRLPVGSTFPNDDVLADARRIVILRLDNAGDVMLAGPTIRALRAAHPDAHLTLVASPVGAEAAELLPWLDDVVPWRALWQDASGSLAFDPDREQAAIERLRCLRADAALILTSFSQTPFAAGYACYLAGIPIRIGHQESFGGGVLSHPVPGPAPIHQAERNLHLIRSVGVTIDDSTLAARVPDGSRALSARLIRSAGDDTAAPIVVAPGASCSARRYDPTYFAQAAAELRARTERLVVVIGTAKERRLAAPIIEAVPDALDLVGRTSLVEAAAVIEAAGVVLANDSLAMHLADAFERPVVVAFAGTDAEAEWGPRKTRYVLLREPTPCAPCRLFDCPVDGHPCVAIDPRRVVDAAMLLLGGERRASVRTPMSGVAPSMDSVRDRAMASASWRTDRIEVMSR
ncbi:MAG: glycosyltransferase family 9 protein [Chloroflexota bacterium]